VLDRVCGQLVEYQGHVTRDLGGQLKRLPVHLNPLLNLVRLKLTCQNATQIRMFMRPYYQLVNISSSAFNIA
jgi:hypothetical protein